METLFEMKANDSIREDAEVSIKYFEATILNTLNNNRNSFSNISKINKNEYLDKTTGK